VLISVVIPVCDEVDSLEALYRELAEVASRHDYDLDVIFVDDGSTDGSWGLICKLSAEDARVRGLRFRKNFGKAAALTAGFEAARGQLVFTMDADLQDDPHEIPRFLDAIHQGYDVVSGWKQVRHDPWHKVLPSHVFNWLVSRLTGVELHDHNCGLKCYRREVLDELDIHGGMYRFATVLVASRGYKVGEVVVHHRSRRFGHSHYGISRFFKGALDLITVWFHTRFGDKPQYLFGSIAAVLFIWGLIGWFFSASWFAFASILIAVQLFVTGLVAEIVAAHYATRTKSYTIAERVGEEVVEGIDS
jgi:glycosyltransferase involved in cell wall biosynthesis